MLIISFNLELIIPAHTCVKKYGLNGYLPNVVDEQDKTKRRVLNHLI